MVERSRIGPSRQSLRSPLGSLFERFRRSGGVPAAAGGDLASELAPVFAVLDEIEREADAVLRSADFERAAREAKLERDLQQIVEEAHARAERERDAAYQTARAAAEADAAAIVAEGERGAAAIRRRGEGRLPQLVEDVVTRVVGGAW
jgi:vacuolar-type H+-ATPase subunit H